MAVPGIDFRFSNNADWIQAFGISVAAERTPGWTGTPEWSPGAACDLGMARVYEGDLYIARPDPLAGPWTTATAFDADLLPSGASRWLLAGSAKAYARVPLDLTGKAMLVALKACAADGTIIDPRPKLLAGSKDGGFTITNAPQGGVAWSLPRRRARGVAPGLYRYDLLAQGADESARRVRFGLILIDEGIVP